MEIIGIIIMLLVGAGLVAVVSAADKITDSRQEYLYKRHLAQQDILLPSTGYVPIIETDITYSTDQLTLLKYKLQNEEYMNQVLRMGLLYFGFSHLYTGIAAASIDPHKFANVVHANMPFITENLSVDTIHTNLPLDQVEYFGQVANQQSIAANVYLNEPPARPSLPQDAYVQPSPMDNPHIFHDQVDHNEHTINHDNGDMHPEFIDVHVEHDMNFFPFLMTEPQFNQADPTYTNPIPMN
jgi:hypothetical protein